MRHLRQVILILADTQRRDMLGAFGAHRIHTPNLDRLASTGVLFNRAYTAQASCGPARSAILTGLYPHANGCWANNLPLAHGKTVGQRLQATGLSCGYIGTWHLDGTDYFGSGHPALGWEPDAWYDLRCYLEELSPADRVRSRLVGTTFAGAGVSASFTYAHRCSDRALAFVEQHRRMDFLLVVSYDESHHPFLAPQCWVQAQAALAFPDSPNQADGLADKPEHIRRWAQTGNRQGKDTLTAFLGCHAFLDHEVGRLFTGIDRYAPDALVLYAADHGDGLGAHGIWGTGPALYEEIVGVPLIVRWPGHLPAGARWVQPVSLVDITPTILEAFGVPLAAGGQGESLLGMFGSDQRPAGRSVFIEFNRDDVDDDGTGGFLPIRGVTDGHFKLVVNLLTTDELYDLDRDPYELTNLIDRKEFASRRNALHHQLLEWMNHTRDPFRGHVWEARPWRLDATPATWDYTGMTRQRQAEPDEAPLLDYVTGLEMLTPVRRK